jgi:phosphatidylethanolamine-binding protein (PEBP) family uncharacterized protein
VAEFEFTSPGFEHELPIRRKHTFEGEDVSPPLAWGGVAEGAASLALVVDDPDAPGRNLRARRAWGIATDTASLRPSQTSLVLRV